MCLNPDDHCLSQLKREILIYLKKWTNLLDVVQNAKILSLSVTSDGCWDLHTKSTALKGNSRLWFLRRLKLLGDTLLLIYKVFCRSVLEYCTNGNLSKGNIQSIERVRKGVFNIIIGTNYTDYKKALEKN